MTGKLTRRRIRLVYFLIFAMIAFKFNVDVNDGQGWNFFFRDFIVGRANLASVWQ